MYAVVVTWGTTRNMPYVCGVRSMQDARKLREAAFERGYKDARIEDETFFRETLDPYRRRSADSRQAA
jgi:hypothetical protein